MWGLSTLLGHTNVMHLTKRRVSSATNKIVRKAKIQLFRNIIAMKPIDIIITTNRRNITEQEPNTSRHVCRLLNHILRYQYANCVTSANRMMLSYSCNINRMWQKKRHQSAALIMMCCHLTGCGQRGIAIKNQFICHFVQPNGNDIALGKITLQYRFGKRVL